MESLVLMASVTRNKEEYYPTVRYMWWNKYSLVWNDGSVVYLDSYKTRKEARQRARTLQKAFIFLRDTKSPEIAFDELRKQKELTNV